MPRFPTIRVIGSQDMSTTLPASGLTRSRVAMAAASSVAPAGLVAGGDRRGQPAAGRSVHERHELVGEAGHRAADADAADVRAAADPGHPAALRHVAVHDGAPAPGLD